MPAVSQEDAVAKVDFSSVEQRFTHGDPFLANRFRDYMSKSALPAGAYLGVGFAVLVRR